MKLPYEGATSGERAYQDIEKILQRFGCDQIGKMINTREGSLLIQFEHRGRQVSLKASLKGYAAMWIKEHPWSQRQRCTRVDHERKALELASVAVYSILRDWVKGQITAVECGILSFDEAFLAQTMLPNGRTVGQEVMQRKMLPAPVVEG